MQRDLDALMGRGSTWGMKFNAKKCNIMRLSRSRKPLQHFYSLGNEILQEVSDAKYLGIQIDNKLDWNKHISTVAARGQSKLAFLNITTWIVCKSAIFFGHIKWFPYLRLLLTLQIVECI